MAKSSRILICKWVRILTDIAMAVAFILQFSSQVTGRGGHEYSGMALVLFAILHTIWNRKWYTTIFRGKYTVRRFLQMSLNLALMISFLLSGVSGMLMSMTAVPFMSVDAWAATSRLVHLAFTHWAFIFAGLHLGMHVERFFMRGKNRIGLVLFSLVAIYGAYAFIQGQMYSYLFLQSQFVFLDYESPAIVVILNNAAILGLFSFIPVLIRQIQGILKESKRRKNYMEYVTLSNGVKAPVLGIGTFRISPQDTEYSVYEALKMGYRLIDTANAYLNEEAVGKAIMKAIEEGIVKREDIFVSTKLWPTLYENESAVEDTLNRLGLSYVDLLFIHQPSGNYLAGYRQLEKAYKDGKAKSLGISNFHDEKLEDLLANTEVKPHVIQLEAHPYFTEHVIMDRLHEYGTRLMGWYPLGHGDPGLVKEEIFTKLAGKYHKSNAQIVLRWHIQKGFITIPGSKNPDHIRDNADIFDFTLTEDEMAEIAKLDDTKRYYQGNAELEDGYASMHLPFEK